MQILLRGEGEGVERKVELSPTLADCLEHGLELAGLNDAPIGGVKVVAGSGWFAARPSGTENVYKLYAESFKDQAHLDAIFGEAQEIVSSVLKLT